MTKQMQLLLVLLLSLTCVFIFSCGDDDDDDDSGSSPADDDTADDDDDDSDDSDDDDSDDDDDDSDDDDDDVDENLPRFSSFVPVPAESVLPQSVDPCAVYQQTQCINDTIHMCDIYDGDTDAWETAPDPMLEQMYYYDRYYDLYHEMEGQHSDLKFTQPMFPGTPESEWGDPQYFKEYDGYGDGAGWTGTVLQSAAARYQVTGTSADYDRMIEKLDTMVLLYTMNEIPGMLMRSFFAMLEDGAPDPIGHPGKAVAPYIEPGDWHFRYPISQDSLDDLPAYFTEGVNILGTDYEVTPKWMGDASRDMYVRSLPGLMLAYDLLGQGAHEDELRAAIEAEIPCTLKRMKKFQITNLQEAPLLLDLLRMFFGTDRLVLEPDDFDVTEIDTIVGYVMEQPNPEFMEAFDASCPDTLPSDAQWQYNIDASNTLEFLFKMVNIAGRSQRKGRLPIAWIQTPSIRGSDALFMTQWALAAHYLTGDERFLEFNKNLMEEIPYWDSVDQMGSFWSPKWCRPHFAPSLLYPTLWNIQQRIDKDEYPEYWNALGGYIAEEYRYKELADANDAYFGILYDAMVDSSIDADASDYAQEMVTMLAQTGQMGVADKNEPRRNYPVDLIANPPQGLVTADITQEDIDTCMVPITIFGETFELGDISDTRPRAVEGMPISWRITGSFQWQYDPFMLYRDYGGVGADIQWPMQGLSVAFWTGRMQSTITAGQGSALAWHDTGNACQ